MTAVAERPPSGAAPPPRRRRSSLALVSAVAVGIVVALLVIVLATREPAENRISKSPLVGKLAPAIKTKTLDGKPFDLDRYEGEWVFVNFFATWCVPCRREHPELLAFSKAHAEKGDASVVSVVSQDDPGTVKDFFAERGGDWPVVEDSDGELTLAYGVGKIPESYLIAPDGTIVAKFTSATTAAGIDKVIAAFEPGS